jgi:PBP1b-binding outer membrane lipoprotein LpoB
MIKKAIYATILMASMVVCGCSTTNTSVSDGPVAPVNPTYEDSKSGDPQLRPMNFFWED